MFVDCFWGQARTLFCGRNYWKKSKEAWWQHVCICSYILLIRKCQNCIHYLTPIVQRVILADMLSSVIYLIIKPTKGFSPCSMLHRWWLETAVLTLGRSKQFSFIPVQNFLLWFWSLSFWSWKSSMYCVYDKDSQYENIFFPYLELFSGTPVYLIGFYSCFELFNDFEEHFASYKNSSLDLSENASEDNIQNQYFQFLIVLHFFTYIKWKFV